MLPANCWSWQPSYHNPVNSGSWHSCRLWLSELPKKSWHSCSFQSYLTTERCYASRQLSELTTVAFRVTFQKRNITSWLFGSKIPLLLFLAVSYTQRVENNWTETLQNLCCQIELSFLVESFLIEKPSSFQ